jgi:uncharacterized protein YabN with tetrapyrrole methylase and pyrophosphatase domain
VVNALQLYREGSLRTINYETVAVQIADSLETVRPVAYVTYGNPMSFDSVAQNLIELSAKRNFRIEVVPGISSVDAILCDLRVDMAPAIQIFDASWLWAAHLDLNPTIPVLLFQIGAFGSLKTHYNEPPAGESLEALVVYLCQYYPSTHPANLVRSKSCAQDVQHLRKLPIGDLVGLDRTDIGGASLYIPSVNLPGLDEDRMYTMMQK